MARAQSVSLKELTKTVQTAVKAAIQKHPKFKHETPQEIVVFHLIWGFPVPPELVANATFSEVEAFANDTAAGLGEFQPGSTVGAQARPQGVVYSCGGHII